MFGADWRRTDGSIQRIGQTSAGSAQATLGSPPTHVFTYSLTLLHQSFQGARTALQVSGEKGKASVEVELPSNPGTNIMNSADETMQKGQGANSGQTPRQLF
jgi:hypothetical protein